MCLIFGRMITTKILILKIIIQGNDKGVITKRITMISILLLVNFILQININPQTT